MSSLKMPKEKSNQVATTKVTVRPSASQPTHPLADTEQNLNIQAQLMPDIEDTEVLKRKCAQIAKAVINKAKARLISKQDLATNPKEEEFISKVEEFFLSKNNKDIIASIDTSQTDKLADQLAYNLINNQVFKVETNCCLSQRFTIDCNPPLGLGGIINYAMQSDFFE